MVIGVLQSPESSIPLKLRVRCPNELLIFTKLSEETLIAEPQVSGALLGTEGITQ